MKTFAVVLVCAGLLSSGCLQVLGLDDYKNGSGGDGGASGSTTSANGSSSSGTCVLDAPCYSGAEGTEGKGNCKAGTSVCDGGQLASCSGEVTPTAEDFYTPGDESCDGHPRGDLLNVSEHPGGFAAVEGIAVDADGNVVIAGFFTPSVNFGPAPSDTLVSAGETDFFVAKFSAAGTFLWSKRIGGSTKETVVDIAVSPDNRIWLFGVFADSIVFGSSTLHATGSAAYFVAQLDETGAPLRARALDTSPALGASIAALASGDVVVGAPFESSIDLGVGAPLTTTGTGSFVARIRSTDLSTAWARAITDAASIQGGPDGDVRLVDLASDSGDNVIAAGTFTGSVYAGNNSQIADGGTDGFALRLTPSGDESALAHLGGAGEVSIDGVAADSTGRLAVVGGFTGALRLKDSFGIPATLNAAGGATDSDLFVWKLTAAGKHEWSKQQGDASAQLADSSDPVLGIFKPSLAFSPDGKLVHVGRFLGSMMVGDRTLTSKGADDAMLIVYAADGSPEWAKSFGDGVPLQMGTAVAVRGTDLFAAFINPGSMDLGKGPMSAMAPDTSELLLAHFEL